MVIIFYISIKIPNEDSIMLPNGDDLSIVAWIEKNGGYRICVSNETLEEVWNGLLNLVIPDFDHTILARADHVSRIERHVNVPYQSPVTA